MFGAILGAIGLGSSLYGAKRSKDNQEAAGRASAELIRKETAEEVRLMERENEYLLGQTSARTGASGIQMSGTAEMYRTSMSEEMDRAVEWAKDAGEARADYALKSGSYAGKTAMRSGISSAIGYAGGIANAGYDAGWWGGGNTVSKTAGMIGGSK